jgi:hypothetical protein
MEVMFLTIEVSRGCKLAAEIGVVESSEEEVWTSASVRVAELFDERDWDFAIGEDDSAASAEDGRIGGAEIVMKLIGFELAVLRIFAIAHSQEKESKSLVYEVIALARHPKYTLRAFSVQLSGGFFVLSSRRREY